MHILSSFVLLSKENKIYFIYVANTDISPSYCELATRGILNNIF